MHVDQKSERLMRLSFLYKSWMTTFPSPKRIGCAMESSITTIHSKSLYSRTCHGHGRTRTNSRSWSSEDTSAKTKRRRYEPRQS